MAETTPQQFVEQLRNLHALALQEGWMSFHMADAVGIKRKDLMHWMRGEDLPPTSEMFDQCLTMICRTLELNPA
jgi:hypothetical protein